MKGAKISLMMIITIYMMGRSLHDLALHFAKVCKGEIVW